MFGKTIVKVIMLTANILVVVIMLLSLVGTKVSPDVFILPSYISLFFPIVVFLNICFVIFWMIARKWLFLISLVTLFFSATQIADTFPLNFGKTKTIAQKVPLKILSYNTMMTGGLEKHTPKHPNQLIQFILDTDADIVCLQEFAVSPKEEYLTQKDVLSIFRKYPYHHIWYKQEQNWAKSGVATFSKFPILNKENIPIKSRYNVSIYSDIIVNNDTIRLFNNHLESNKLTERDRELPVQLKDGFNTDKLSGTTLHLSRKLGNAYKKRAMQADTIACIISQSPYKVIVCGDFNDHPVSYAYTKIKSNMKDAFAENGFGLGWTLNLSIYKFRIDFMLYDDAIASDNFKISKVNYSDHYPIQCDFYLN